MESDVLKEYEKAVAEAKAKVAQKLLQTEEIKEGTEGVVLFGKRSDGKVVEVSLLFSFFLLK
jgi:hypothetical protein